MTTIIGVILAAGTGGRTAFDRPKQLVKLGGRPMIEHTLEAFQQAEGVHEIAIVTNDACHQAIEDIVLRRRFSKVKKILLGGTHRYESSLAAIRAYDALATQTKVRLIFHDAVRPLVSQRIIAKVVESLEHYNAVDVVIPSTDTIVVADPLTNTIAEIPDRQNLRNGQTPQGFAFETIKEAYAHALADPTFKTTDDCGTVRKYLPEEPIYLVSGESANIKLTYDDDLPLLDKLLQLRSIRSSTTEASDFVLTKLKGKTLVVFGGGSGIGASICALAKAHQANVYSATRSSGVNISSAEQVSDYLSSVSLQTGNIDYVINTAAVLHLEPLANMSYPDILSSVGVNYLGPVNVALGSFTHLRRSEGQLLFFTSSSYTYGRAYYSLYSSAKAAVVNLAQALADEWNDDRVRVNCINPDRTMTPMRTKAFGSEDPQTLLDPRHVAAISLMTLISPYTGQVINITKT